MRLFHYTSMAAGMSILKHAELWLSNVRCQNDPDEYRHGLSILEDRLGAKKVETLKEEGRNYWIACFATNGDQSQQWHQYADSGRGMCIEFDSDTIFQNSEGTGSGRFHEVIYRSEAQQESIDRCVQEMWNTGASFDLLRTLCTMKKEAFSGESEYRYLLSTSALRFGDSTAFMHTVLFHERQGFIKPYVTLKLNMESIKSVRLGPKSPPSNYPSMQMFVTSHGIKCEVKESSFTIH